MSPDPLLLRPDSHSLRLTPVRRQMLAALATHDQPVTLAVWKQAVGHMPRASIYDNRSWLESRQLVVQTHARRASTSLFEITALGRAVLARDDLNAGR